MSITLTQAAADRVTHFMTQRQKGVGLRLGIKRNGCSGYSYTIDYADAVNDNDTVFEDRGVKVVIDADSLPIIEGTEVDFVKEGLAELFRFRNPRAIGECGCGESFTIDEQDKQD